MLLRTLVDLGYVVRDKHDLYGINPALLGYGLGWIGGPRAVLVQTSWPVLEHLTARILETSFLATINSEMQLQFLAKIVSPREIRYDLPMQRRSIPHKTASGRVILAHWNDERMQKYIRSWNKTSIALSDRVEPLRLREQLAEARKAGFALLVDEWVAGATGVSAPVFDAEGVPVAAVTLGAVTARFLSDRAEIIEAVTSAARELTARLPAGLNNMRLTEIEAS